MIEPQTMPDTEQFTQWIQGEYDYNRPQRGEVREGVILSLGDNDVVVDIGVKRDGIVPPRDLDLLEEAYRAGLAVGDHVPVVVLDTRGQHDGIIVSINKGLQQQDWLHANALLESQEVIKSQIIDLNRGGVIVEFGQLRGFVPNSHLTAIPRGLRGEQLQEAKQELIGQTLPLVVIEIDQQRRRLILSQRVAEKQRRQDLLQGLEEGQVRTGVVRNLTDFGVFVDLGGIDGLIHISELDREHVEHPRDALSVGDEVKVYVLGVDRERARISLSRKALLPDPWEQVSETLQPDDVVEGTVTGLASFGVFVDVGSGVEGLVHNSEIADNGVTRGDLETGDTVTVRVLDIDDQRQRIALRLQQSQNPLHLYHQDARAQRESIDT